MIKRTTLFLLLLTSSCVFAQQTISHSIKKGETLYSISRKYGVTPYDILSKNPDLKAEALRIGRVIEIPAPVPRAVVEKPTKNAFQAEGYFELYTVKPHQTLYALSKIYDVSVQDLRDWNDGLPEGIKAGMRLKIRRSKISSATPYQSAINRSEAAQRQEVERDSMVSITVQPGQSLFSIMRQTQLRFAQLLQLNPALADGLQAGMRLDIGRTSAHKALDFDKNAIDFGDKINVSDQIGAQTRLNVVLLAPFYTRSDSKTLGNFGADNTADTASHRIFNADSDAIPDADSHAIVKDKSRYATEFSIGARLALEALEKKGLHIHFSIFDTGRDPRQLEDILAANDLEKADLIIGPFYTDLSELTAQSVGDTPVVSPFSQRLDLNGHPNLIQLLPSAALMQKKILDWVLHESDPTSRIWVLGKPSPARDKTLDYLRSKTILPIEVRAELPADSTLYELAGQSLQVVFPDSADADYSECLYKLAEINTDSTHIRVYFTHDVSYYNAMPLRDKVGLQITLPRMPYCDRDNKSYRELEKKFIEKYEMGPRVYELMGYDTVYEFLMRLSQHPNLYQSLQSQRSQGIELVTDFKKWKGGGYFNDAVSLLRYGKKGLKPIGKAR